jgi:hypothetical protein
MDSQLFDAANEPPRGTSCQEARLKPFLGLFAAFPYQSRQHRLLCCQSGVRGSNSAPDLELTLAIVFCTG